MFLLALLVPNVLAADLLQGDALPPGGHTVSHILRSGGGFTGAELVTTSCADLIVGPVFVADGVGNPSAPVNDAVLSVVFIAADDASPADCTVSIDGVALAAVGGIDNKLSVVSPAPAPVDGGVGDDDGAADGVITL
ncbi:hypothetical protein L6R46_32065, partial [Myxococcota bacterium]|nr:hypothetical protein [Myxococcota bacterium]